jgi:hypothetical protein
MGREWPHRNRDCRPTHWRYVLRGNRANAQGALEHEQHQLCLGQPTPQRRLQVLGHPQVQPSTIHLPQRYCARLLLVAKLPTWMARSARSCMHRGGRRAVVAGTVHRGGYDPSHRTRVRGSFSLSRPAGELSHAHKYQQLPQALSSRGGVRGARPLARRTALTSTSGPLGQS